ncbi:MAG: hypothetical protein M0R74_03340 [Dehalococcoidia bacterium]|nr:hypothetical protein [Dehalococcoidia bacterium]
MAASVTLTEETFGVIKKIKWQWTAHTDGEVATTTANATTTKTYNGELVRLVTIPGGSTDAPDSNYDVYVYDEDSTDALMAGGKDRHTSNTEQVAASSLGVVANDKLTLCIEGAGDSNKGTVILYVR